jgi:hypothetical protein
MKSLLLSLIVLCASACSGTEDAAPAGTPSPKPEPTAAAKALAAGETAATATEAAAGAGKPAAPAVPATPAEPAPSAEPAPPAEPAAPAETDAAADADADAVEVIEELVEEPAAKAAGQEVRAAPDLVLPGMPPTDAPKPPSVSIPDIDRHRTESLPYVRKLEDFVELDLGAIDIDADPILIVEGKPVSRAAFRLRAVMYAGENDIDKHITRLLTDRQIAREIARGKDPRAYEPDPADIDQKLNELMELVRMQAMQPTGEPAPDDDPEARGDAAVQAYLDTIDSSIGMDAYRLLLAADAQFERVFLPIPSEAVTGEKHDFEAGPPPLDDPRPDWIPQESWDALGTDEQARMLRTFVKTWAIEGSGIPAMFKPNLLAKIRQGLLESEGLQYFFDTDLPDGVLLRIGEELVTTEQIWPLVLPQLVDTDVDLIVRELLTLHAMRKALEAAGKWFTDEQFEAAWKAENDQYVGTLIPLQTMIMFRGYSSLDRYREHFRYRQAYNAWRREGLTDEEVLSHYQGGGRLLFERGTVVVDVLYAPLAGLPFEEASLETRRAELAAAIDAARPTGEGWVEVLTERFPPPPARQGMDAHAMQRSQVRMQTAESELSIFLTGYSKSDDLFYHAHKGDVYGPWTERCRRHVFGAEANAGAWAVHVRDYSRRSTLPPFDGMNRDLAFQDYLDLNYFYWAQESLKALLPAVKLPGR